METLFEQLAQGGTAVGTGLNTKKGYVIALRLKQFYFFLYFVTCIALNTSIFIAQDGLVLSLFVSENYSDKTVNHFMDLAIMNMNSVFFPLNIIQKECFSASVFCSCLL